MLPKKICQGNEAHKPEFNGLLATPLRRRGGRKSLVRYLLNGVFQVSPYVPVVEMKNIHFQYTLILL